MSEAKTEITPEMIADVAKFLCRECSCQVKELNPGVDLLFVADWRDYFDRIYEGKEPVPMPVMTTATLGTRQHERGEDGDNARDDRGRRQVSVPRVLVSGEGIEPGR